MAATTEHNPIGNTGKQIPLRNCFTHVNKSCIYDIKVDL